MTTETSLSDSMKKFRQLRAYAHLHERREEEICDQSDIVESDEDRKLPYRASQNIAFHNQRNRLSDNNQFVTPQRQTRKRRKS